MKHADELIKRILFLEGLPNVQKLERVMIGTNIEEVIECDLKVEHAAVPHLKDCIELAEKERDYVSRDLFRSILESEEHHVDWLETQQHLIKQVGIQNFIQAQMTPDEANH
jgi:bacterioferritin